MHAAENPDQRRLARTVFPDDRVDLAKAHIEIDAVEGQRRAEMFAAPLEARGRHGRLHSLWAPSCRSSPRKRGPSANCLDARLRGHERISASYRGTNATCIFGSVNLPRSMIT